MEKIRTNYTPGKIQNLLEGEQPAPLFYNKAFGKYHCMVELGFNTESQKQMQFAQLLQLKEIGVPIPNSSLIEAATIQDKEKIGQQMQAEQQQIQQMQTQQAQVAMQELQARTHLAHSRAYADEGLGNERNSRIEENKALAQERKAAAIKDDYLALLNFAKAVKEMENVDISQLAQLLELQRNLNEPQPAQKGSEAVR